MENVYYVVSNNQKSIIKERYTLLHGPCLCLFFLEPDKYLTKNELNTHRDIHIHIHIYGKAITDPKMKCILQITTESHIIRNQILRKIN